MTSAECSAGSVSAPQKRDDETFSQPCPEMEVRGVRFGVAMRPGKRCVQPDTPDGLLDDLVETPKPYIHAKGEHPFRVIKRQFGLQKTRLRRMLKNRCKVNMLAALSTLFMAPWRLPCTA